jgi:hypothetical protein
MRFSCSCVGADRGRPDPAPSGDCSEVPIRWHNLQRRNRTNGTNGSNTARLNQIKPDQTFRLRQGATSWRGKQKSQKLLWFCNFRRFSAIPLVLRESSRIKVNQTKSNQIKPARAGVRVASGQLLAVKEAGARRPGQTQSNQSNRFDPKLTTNMTILSEILILDSILVYQRFRRRDADKDPRSALPIERAPRTNYVVVVPAYAKE